MCNRVQTRDMRLIDTSFLRPYHWSKALGAQPTYLFLKIPNNTPLISGNECLLLEYLQVIHDEMLLEEIESVKASESDQIPLPLQHLQKFIQELNSETTLNSTNSLRETVITSCMREMYQYARVHGVHVLECVMDTALSAVRKEELQEASDVLFTVNLLRFIFRKPRYRLDFFWFEHSNDIFLYFSKKN